LRENPDRAAIVCALVEASSAPDRDPISIVLADDHAVVRRGLRLVLETESDMHAVAEAGDGAEAVRRAVHDDVDLAVLDISMPGMTGIQAAQELSRLRPRLRTLILSMHDSEQYFLEAIRAGASGYVLKSVADHDLITACRAAMRGEPFVYPTVERSLLGRALADDESSAVLTGRESQILALIADGHTSREIADMLVISPRTVERHRENLRHKLGLRNRVDLTRYAIRAGLISP
jgi:DNA-binding NarL/FixJ family response regulator